MSAKFNLSETGRKTASNSIARIDGYASGIAGGVIYHEI